MYFYKLVLSLKADLRPQKRFSRPVSVVKSVIFGSLTRNIPPQFEPLYLVVGKLHESAFFLLYF
jgi:hypothetical protein